MIKPSSLKDLLTGLTLPSLSRWTSLGRESPFHHKVVYNVNDGRSLWQKSIHHGRENTMHAILEYSCINGRPFLCHSILWQQICRSDYQTLFEQQVFLQQMAPVHLCRHDSLEQLNITSGLSLRAGGRGFSPATTSLSPGYFDTERKYWKEKNASNYKIMN